MVCSSVACIVDLQNFTLSMQVVSTAMLQLGELTLGLSLLQYTAKPGRQVGTFFAGKFSSRPSWVKETVLWLGLLMSMVFLTSLIADRLIGTEVSTVEALEIAVFQLLHASPVVLFIALLFLTEALQSIGST